VIAQFQAELVFTLRVETSVTFETGRERWPLRHFASNNFGMDFKRVHENSPQRQGARAMPAFEPFNH
jgi:hypothetical protein